MGSLRQLFSRRIKARSVLRRANPEAKPGKIAFNFKSPSLALLNCRIDIQRHGFRYLMAGTKYHYLSQAAAVWMLFKLLMELDYRGFFY